MIKCGVSGCENEVVGRCYYCDIPLCREHFKKVDSDRGEELYCSACYLYLLNSGMLEKEKELARRVAPNVLWINSDKCTGCRTCEMVCSFEHFGLFSPSLSCIKIMKKEERVVSIPVLCIHCDDPQCVPVCPVGALNKDFETSLVVLDEQTCTGCKNCIEACPYGVISYAPQMNKILKCDLCGGAPKCAEYCEPKALEWTKKYRVGERRSPIALRHSLQT